MGIRPVNPADHPKRIRFRQAFNYAACTPIEVASILKHARVMSTAILIASLFVSSSGHSSSPKTVITAFAKLQALAGDWEGKADDGNPAKTSFKPVASNTTILETLSMSGLDEMLTLYSLDRDGIALVHYCPTNNQPRMRAIPQEDAPKELTFQFQGATNLPDLAVGHEHQLVILFEDKDHITEQWIWRKNGKDKKMTYHFVRKSAN
jgi:hypothetical protein